MNLKQLENIIAIADEGNISHAAEKLFISQSGLSQSLLNLEKELGIPLFKRFNKKMIPTYAGEQYITSAKKIIEIKRITYKQLSDISNSKKGRFTVGITSTRGLKMFSKVYPDFYKQYPEVIINSKESGAKHLETMILRGEIDIGTVSTKEFPKEMNYELLDKEELFFIIHKSHPLASIMETKYNCILRYSDLKLFEYDNFIATNKDTSLRALTDDICNAAGFTPNIVFESSSASPILNMVKVGMGVGFISDKGINREKDVIYLSFNPREDRCLWAAYRKDNYLTEPERYYIKLIKSYFI